MGRAVCHRCARQTCPYVEFNSSYEAFRRGLSNGTTCGGSRLCHGACQPPGRISFWWQKRTTFLLACSTLHPASRQKGMHDLRTLPTPLPPPPAALVCSSPALPSPNPNRSPRTVPHRPHPTAHAMPRLFFSRSGREKKSWATTDLGGWPHGTNGPIPVAARIAPRSFEAVPVGRFRRETSSA